MKSSTQINTKKRVSDHGEVFTAEREVKAMLDLVKNETERIDSRFLEPACGTGNFLVEILRRKLDVVSKRYKKSRADYEINAISAIGSIYGVDILIDNVEQCRDRLMDVFSEYYRLNFKKNIQIQYLEIVRFILKRNILWGDALSLKTPDPKPEDIVFSEWVIVKGGMIKRRDFSMSNLLEKRLFDGLSLFSDLGEEVLIPVPVADFPLTHYLKINLHAIN